jgi:hypothetical protein
MKFFIDTANLAQITEANELGILDGVTTNPSLMAKEGIKGTEAVMKHYKDICDIVHAPVSAEVISTDFAGIVEDGKISNLILAQSKDSAEQITGAECIEYDNTLVNPKIGQSVVDGEVVDLEVYLVLEINDLQLDENGES